MFSKELLERGINQIRKAYEGIGYFGSSIVPTITYGEDNSVGVLISIQEGVPLSIGQIEFEGNHSFSARLLRRIIGSKQKSSWCWSRSARTYDPARLSHDQEMLKQFYVENGYLDFVPSEPHVEISADESTASLVFPINEGSRYRFGRLSVEISMQHPPEQPPTINLTEGSWFDEGAKDRAENELYEQTKSQGGGFVSVKPVLSQDKATHAVDVDYEVSDGPDVYVERIDIVGNTRTEDKVIRRKFELAEGDRFDAAALRTTRKRLMDLDYFSDVKFTIAPGSASDKAIVTASVVEKATGTVSIGLKPHAAPAVQLALSELNLLGRGYDLVAKTEFALKGTETEVSFTDPYWLDQNLPAKWGVSLSTGSADSWTTPIVGFQLTLWAGVLVFPIPIVLLILLRGAYKSYALTGNPARQVREYRKTMQAVKIAVTLQVCYVIATQGVHYMLSKTDVAMYASHFVCD